MNLSKKILRAINEGILNALSFDDEDFEEDDMQLLKVTALYDIDRHNKMAQKIYYLDKFEELIPDPMEITKDAIDQAIEWYNKCGVTYNPHLDSEEFEIFIKKIISIMPNANLNWIDTSDVTNMAFLFYGKYFIGDISEWNTENVVNMNNMFNFSNFNGDISKWDVSHVITMSTMFARSEFNGDISNWDVSSVEDMGWMFRGSKFNGDISKWNVKNVNWMSNMFKESVFRQDISTWEIKPTCKIDNMFKDCAISHENMPKLLQ